MIHLAGTEMKLKTKAFMRLVSLSPKALVCTGELDGVETYDVYFDHQFLETEKYDAKPTYQKFLGYRPGVYVIGDSG